MKNRIGLVLRLVNLPEAPLAQRPWRVRQRFGDAEFVGGRLLSQADEMTQLRQFGCAERPSPPGLARFSAVNCRGYRMSAALLLPPARLEPRLLAAGRRWKSDSPRGRG